MISASARRLSVFKCVVDLGGFNAAATRLGIAQPSVGAHIKALEAQIGQPLFYRHRGTRPALTKAGETLHAYAVEVLRQSEETAHTLTDLRAADAREIALAAHRDVGPYLLPRHLASFAAKHPKVRIVTHSGTIPDVLEKVRTRTCQLGLFLAAGPVGGVQSEILAHEPMALVVAPTHMLARRKSVNPKDLSAFPFVTGLRKSRYFHMTDMALKNIGLASYNVAMEVEDSAGGKEMVRYGAGIAVLPACTAADELKAGSLVRLKVNPAPHDFEVRCAYHAPLADIARKLVEHLRERLGK